MFHLSPVPVFLLVLSAPAIKRLLTVNSRLRAALIILVAVTLVQGASFQWRYYQSARSPWRQHLFDAGYPKMILEPALANARRPIYLLDAAAIPGYIQAYWYATLRGVPISNLNHLPIEYSPPPDTLVITTKDTCVNGFVLSETPPYKLYVSAQSQDPCREATGVK